MPDDDDGILIGVVGTLWRHIRYRGGLYRGVGRSTFGFDVNEPLRVGLDLEWSIVSRPPERVTLHLSSLELSGQRDDKPDILFPYYAPKVLVGGVSTMNRKK